MAESSGPCRKQRGMSGSVQVTLLLPLAMLVLLAALQWSLLLWAESTAMAAAQDSARAAAVLGGSVEDGREAGKNAVTPNGIAKDWPTHLSEFAQSDKPLRELFPGGGFALHGNSKVFAPLRDRKSVV